MTRKQAIARLQAQVDAGRPLIGAGAGTGLSAKCAEFGRRMAAVLGRAAGPVVAMIPRRGVSALDTPGMPFHDPEADEALVTTLRELVDASKVEVHEVDADVNDPAFATAMADRLHELIQEARGDA